MGRDNHLAGAGEAFAVLDAALARLQIALREQADAP